MELKSLTGALRVVQPESRDFRMLTDPAHAAYYEQNNMKNTRLTWFFSAAGRRHLHRYRRHHGNYTLLAHPA